MLFRRRRNGVVVVVVVQLTHIFSLIKQESFVRSFACKRSMLLENNYKRSLPDFDSLVRFLRGWRISQILVEHSFGKFRGFGFGFFHKCSMMLSLATT